MSAQKSPATRTGGFAASRSGAHRLAPEDFVHGREVLIRKVRRFWVEGVLRKAAPAEERIPLRFVPIHEAVERPWAEVEAEVALSTPAQGLILSDDLGRSFGGAGRALLLLSGPGGGKTIATLGLAERLLDHAARDPDQPIPVVLSLSSWGERKEPLADWIVGELAASYRVPKKMGRAWLESGELLLFLDDLAADRAGPPTACVAAINEFRERHGLVGLLVCGRRDDYDATGIRLRMGGAAMVAPLYPEQIEELLDREPERHAALREALRREPSLAQMARSPQLLSLMKGIYERSAEVGASAAGSTEAEEKEPRARLLAAYAAQALRGPGEGPEEGEAIERGLRWLARRMRDHHQRLFLLDRLQPSWLRPGLPRWAYLLGSRLLYGASAGLAAGLASEATRAIVPRHQLAMMAAASEALGLRYGGVLALLGLGALAGLLLGLFDGVVYTRRAGRPDEAEGSRARALLHMGAACASAFSAVTPIVALYDPLIEALVEGLIVAIALTALGNHPRASHSFRTEVGVVEALRWSWAEALRLLPIGLLAGLLLGSVRGFEHGLTEGLFFVAAMALFFFLWGGLRGSRVEGEGQPDQGIRRSLKNGASAALLLGLAFFALYGLYAGPRAGLLMGSVVTLSGGLIFGLGAAFNHLLVRLLLRLDRGLPLPLPALLRRATARGLLRRVGGGYLFAQGLLQDHLAEERESGSA